MTIFSLPASAANFLQLNKVVFLSTISPAEAVGVTGQPRGGRTVVRNSVTDPAKALSPKHSFRSAQNGLPPARHNN